MRNVTEHLENAVIALGAASREVKQGTPLNAEDVSLLFSLMDQIVLVRNQMIQRDLLLGMSGKEAAVKYNLSAPRISQIKRMAA